MYICIDLIQILIVRIIIQNYDSVMCVNIIEKYCKETEYGQIHLGQLKFSS